MRLKIKEVRIAKGVSQTELAKRVGDYQSHVSRWERGEVSTSKLIKIAKALGCKVDDLIEKGD